MSVNILNNLVKLFPKKRAPALPTLLVWKSGVLNVLVVARHKMIYRELVIDEDVLVPHLFILAL